jgi:hypothetical protein
MSAADQAAVASRLSEWLALAATPTFAGMAALTAVFGGPSELPCGAAQGSLLGGMVPMYLSMSAFHSGAWLRFMNRRPRAEQTMS